MSWGWLTVESMWPKHYTREPGVFHCSFQHRGRDETIQTCDDEVDFLFAAWRFQTSKSNRVTTVGIPISSSIGGSSLSADINVAPSTAHYELMLTMYIYGIRVISATLLSANSRQIFGAILVNSSCNWCSTITGTKSVNCQWKIIISWNCNSNWK